MVIMPAELRKMCSNISRDLLLKTYAVWGNHYRVLYPVFDIFDNVLITNTVKFVGRILVVKVENQLFIS